jgi:aryl-alcohol dehydrogenase-like predicted oxidoreductase
VPDEISDLLWRSTGTARIVLGGKFGEEKQSQSYRRLDEFVSAGGRFVDTAYSYAAGAAEEVLGAWLRSNPGTITIMDKIGHPNAGGVLDISTESLYRQVEESRQRLGVTTIDAILLHRDDPAVPVAELTDVLTRFVREGAARAVGFSNWGAERLACALELFADSGITPLLSYQFSLAVPAREIWPGALHADEQIMAAKTRHRLPLLAWAAHARGFLAGRTEPDDLDDDPFDTPANRAARSRCAQVAASLDAPPEAVALAWTLSNPGIFPIIGPRSTAELQVSLAAVRLTLDQSTVDALSRFRSDRIEQH